METEKWKDCMNFIENSTKANRNKIREIALLDSDMGTGVLNYFGKDYRVDKVNINHYTTWFIEGHPLVTFYIMTPTEVKVTYKMSRGGDWSIEGERRPEYEQFVYDVVYCSGAGILPVFTDDTCCMENTLVATDNGYHPHILFKGKN